MPVDAGDVVSAHYVTGNRVIMCGWRGGKVVTVMWDKEKPEDVELLSGDCSTALTIRLLSSGIIWRLAYWS